MENGNEVTERVVFEIAVSKWKEQFMNLKATIP
jgi:hypothetical protein